MTEVVHMNKEEYDVYIGRANGGNSHMNNTDVGEPGWLGNPYTVDEYGRKTAIKKFREDFYARLGSDESFREAVEGLEGKTLGCYCKPKACHGDVIVAYLPNDTWSW